MNQGVLRCDDKTRAEISALFENSPPILIEVRFLGCGTSPDWYLCAEQEQFEKLLEKFGAGVEMHVSSVWDLKNAKGAVCFRM